MEPEIWREIVEIMDGYTSPTDFLTDEHIHEMYDHIKYLHSKQFIDKKCNEWEMETVVKEFLGIPHPIGNA